MFKRLKSPLGNLGLWLLRGVAEGLNGGLGATPPRSGAVCLAWALAPRAYWRATQDPKRPPVPRPLRLGPLPQPLPPFGCKSFTVGVSTSRYPSACVAWGRSLPLWLVF